MRRAVPGMQAGILAVVLIAVSLGGAGVAAAQTAGGRCSRSRVGDSRPVDGVELECREERHGGRSVYRWREVPSGLGGGTSRCLTRPAGTQFGTTSAAELQSLLDQKLGAASFARVTGGSYQVAFVDGEMVVTEQVELTGDNIVGEVLVQARADYRVDGDYLVIGPVSDDAGNFTESFIGGPQIVNQAVTNWVFGGGGRVGFGCDGAQLLLQPGGAAGPVTLTLTRQ